MLVYRFLTSGASGQRNEIRAGRKLVNFITFTSLIQIGSGPALEQELEKPQEECPHIKSDLIRQYLLSLPT